MKRKYLLLFIITFIMFFLYSQFVCCINGDDIWNYGFIYNISKGLIPYRDFNLLQTPLTFYLAAPFIKIFGSYLYSVNIFASIISSLIFLFIYKNINKKAWILFPAILCFNYISYNLLALLLIVIVLDVINNNYKNRDYLIALLLGLLLLTKQNLGILTFIPMLYFNKKKIKSICLYLLPIFIYMLYLECNNALFDFINYAFLGLLDFNNNNKLLSFIWIYLPIMLYILFKIIKSKFKDEELCYVFMFFSIAYPIIDPYHFTFGFIVFIYYLLLNKKFSSYVYSFFIIWSILYFFIMFTISVSHYSKTNSSFYNDNTSYLYLKPMPNSQKVYIKDITKLYSKYEKKYDNVYIMDLNAYLYILNTKKTTGHYDFLLNGNMGYKGDERVIKELKKTCSKEKCVFLINSTLYEQLPKNQFNKKIYNYVKSNYVEIESSYNFKVLTNIIE